ncbi:hypothetical protein AMK59_1025 [Oryctes borbonicus]|uniref:Cytochrome c oxidase assembly factor 7 homolog n=1 Tax=Oryctes borbonicus TaxID=1629725 RepID=A0A0T6BET6_9SCAR|nr:hypothetical protein AMK59_1025 [Oryctes borbonicus]
MAYDFKSESEVKDFLHNLGIEYRFGCYSEKKPEVCHLLGDYLEAIKKDYEKASKVYKSNCDDNRFGKSCLKFGTYALLGKAGLKEDYKTAYEYFKKGCEDNVSDSCFNQGILLISNAHKCGVMSDPIKGMALLEKSCQGENANGCYYTSGFYISGLKKENKSGKTSSNKTTDSVEYDVPKNMELAFKYATKGCELGSILCCINLSQMYAKGEGVRKNEELAKKFKEIALEMQSQMQETNKTLSFQEGLS